MIPAISTLRVESSMTKSTTNRVRPSTGPDVDGEEVRRGDDVPMRLQELGPRRLLHSLWRGFQAVRTKDVGDGASTDLMTEVGQGPLDPRVAPVSVFRGHAHDQRSDLRDDRRSSRPTTCAPVVLLRDQPTMPGQQGVRRDNRADVPQDAPSEYLGFRGEPSPLMVRELQASGAEQFPQARFSSWR